MSSPLVTHGMIGGLGSGVGPGSPPDPSFMTLVAYGAGYATFLIEPPADPKYVGTKIYYGAPNTHTYSEAGPEGPDDRLTVTGLTAEAIYLFIPVAYGAGYARAKPGNVILATTPVNVIDMDQLQLNSEGLECLWNMINRKVDRSELTTSLDRMTVAVRGMIDDKGALDNRLEIMEREIAILRRKIGS